MARRPETRGRDLNHVAWLYDPIIEGFSFGRERRFREKTLEHMAFAPGDRILDVGCGTGSLTLLIAERLQPPGEVIGIDAAPRMIDIACRKAARRKVPARFFAGVAEKLEFADASFDLVVNSMFTHHIDTELKQRAFAEMHRVLRPGGRLVTADVDRPTTLTGRLMGWGARWLLVQRELVDNLRGDLPELMRQAGFVDVRRVDHVYGLVSFFTARRPGVGE
ncbi:demethylmenaquinone methyltransferase/2-methoxy-6-polyprenyl-1,4-benzoquinol methylase [Geothermobacter ehrlichii]|uniref:Demethylmenaquinone methyltransferase/2-methoxy-6-polyprenyl-1,4-benzoquinol methylase n=1 Tax=Geothermobacter ehrlichii TaxID=213224 RepID=A0A5D3WKM4_9BACT|nr:methyltransferase domain-containing protein [Geothermobacter ehrlichii]TYO98938.1 demethylmenaquinone methyltransferase/2-methoxy-6-polyprenyl-1,4-benzoquinol methylase [Geothermobacter ehrlichii]